MSKTKITHCTTVFSFAILAAKFVKYSGNARISQLTSYDTRACVIFYEENILIIFYIIYYVLIIVT